MPTRLVTRRVWVQTRQRKGKATAKTFEVCYYDRQARKRRVERSFHSESLAEESAFKFRRDMSKRGAYPVLDAGRVTVHLPLADPNKQTAKPKRDWTQQVQRWIGMTSGTANTRREKESKLKQFQKAAGVHFAADVTEQMVIDQTNGTISSGLAIKGQQPVDFRLVVGGRNRAAVFGRLAGFEFGVPAALAVGGAAFHAGRHRLQGAGV